MEHCRVCEATENVVDGLCPECQSMHDVMDEAHALIEAEDAQEPEALLAAAEKGGDT